MSTPIVLPVATRGPADHEVRSQIAIAAREHFSRYGYEKTTVSDLAKAIGFSKAYVYKFFDSKRAIGERICADCLVDIETQVRRAVEGAASPPEKLRMLFKTIVESTVWLLSEDNKLYEIAMSAVTDGWPSTVEYESHIQRLVVDILEAGRRSGDFERKTPLDELACAIFLVVRPYMNPVLLRHSLQHIDRAPAQIANLVLRSLSP